MPNLVIYTFFALAILAIAFFVYKYYPIYLSNIAKQYVDKNSIKNIDMKHIDFMDANLFEEYLEKLLKYLRYYDAEQTKISRDYGADITFTDSTGKINVVQAKRYGFPKNKVNVDAVQQVYTSMRVYQAKRAMVITNSKYTEPCEKLASYNYVTLLDRDDLQNIIKAIKSDDINKARKIIEQEPRVELASWGELEKREIS